MNKVVMGLVAVLGLSGCIAYPVYRDHSEYGSHGRDHARHGVYRDRDGDGVPNRRDRRPDNPRRY